MRADLRKGQLKKKQVPIYICIQQCHSTVYIVLEFLYTIKLLSIHITPQLECFLYFREEMAVNDHALLPLLAYHGTCTWRLAL